MVWIFILLPRQCLFRNVLKNYSIALYLVLVLIVLIAIPNPGHSDECVLRMNLLNVTNLSVQVSQKKRYISFENQRFLRIQPPTELRKSRGSVGRWSFKKRCFLKKIWRFFWDTRTDKFVTLCIVRDIPFENWNF